MLTTAAGVVLGGLVLYFLLGTDVGRVILVLSLILLGLAGAIVPVHLALSLVEGRAQQMVPDALMPSARIRDARARHGGHYRIDRLVGGDHFAVAVRSLPHNAWRDPFVLRQLFPQAAAFRLDDGERKTVNLELARTPPGLSP